jgi:cytidylate kinase
VLVVAIDGPAGAGKSTVARALSRRLGIQYLDTGAMYRAVTWAVRDRGVDPTDVTAVAELAARLTIEVELDRVTVDGHDVTAAIRSREVTADVSTVAANSDVRSEMRRRQRAWGELRGGGVIEGRDIGTVVFPDATLKVYLTASPRTRAERRVLESGGDADVIEVEIAERDRKDSSRSDSPLRSSADSVIVDTTDRTVDEVVDELVEHVAVRTAGDGR